MGGGLFWSCFVASGLGWLKVKPESVTAGFWFIQADEGCVLCSSLTSSCLLSHVTSSPWLYGCEHQSRGNLSKASVIERRRKTSKSQWGFLSFNWFKFEGRKGCIHPPHQRLDFKPKQSFGLKCFYSPETWCKLRFARLAAVHLYIIGGLYFTPSSALAGCLNHCYCLLLLSCMSDCSSTHIHSHVQ